MWIEDVDGDLVNLDLMESIYIAHGEDGFAVCAMPVTPDGTILSIKDYTDVLENILFAGTEKECEGFMRRLKYDMGNKLIKLENK